MTGTEVGEPRSAPSPRFALPAAWLLLVALATLLRAPLLRDRASLLDGDEAVQGLMSLHASAGDAHPLFFYGQRYGLCLLETELGALAFGLLGPGPLALRLAMFLTWIVGAAFFVAAAARRGGASAACLAAIVTAAAPVWIPWSLKARGGYASAYLLSGALVWLVSGAMPRTPSSRRRRALAFGALSALLVLAQPTFVLLPLAILSRDLVARELRARGVLLVAASALAVGLPLHGLGLLRATGDHLPSLSNSPSLWQGLLDLPGLFADSIVGAYYMRAALHDGSTTAVGGLWTALVLLVAAATIGRCWRGGRAPPELSFVALLAGSLLVAIPSNVPRYFLPLHATLGVWLATEIRFRWPEGARRGLWLVWGLILLGVALANGVRYERLSYPGVVSADAPAERRSFDALIDRLSAAGVEHAYSLHHLLQWQIAFETREGTLARWTKARDRLPGYPERVDAAWASGAPTALVAHGWQRRELVRALGGEGGLEDCGKHLFVLDPDGALLKRLGFAPTIAGLFDREPRR